jgi:hypothetical protein
MASGQEQVSWAETIRRLERAVGEPLETFVRSNTYFDLLAVARRAQGQLGAALEGAFETWLHTFNMPAATDIRRLREQLSRLERQVNRIEKELADRAEAVDELQSEIPAQLS